MKSFVSLLLAMLASHAWADPHIESGTESPTRETNIYSALQAKDLEFKKTYLRYVRARTTGNAQLEASLGKQLKSLQQEMKTAITGNQELAKLRGPTLRGGYEGEELEVDFIQGMPESATHRKWRETVTANIEAKVNATQGVLLDANNIQQKHQFALENQKRTQAEFAPGYVMIEHYATLVSKHRLDIPVE